MWSQHASAMGCEPMIQPSGQCMWDPSSQPASKQLEHQKVHRERWKEEKKATFTLCKSAENLIANSNQPTS